MMSAGCLLREARVESMRLRVFRRLDWLLNGLLLHRRDHRCRMLTIRLLLVRLLIVRLLPVRLLVGGLLPVRLLLDLTGQAA